MKWAAFDSETNIKNRGEGAVGTFQASPFHPDNHIVSYGEWLQDTGYRSRYKDNKEPPVFLQRAAKGEEILFVAHNVGFDLHYVIKEWREMFWKALPNLRLWCSQQGEYLISGQSETMPSLDFCAIERDLPVKDDRIKKYWAEGIDTEHIPEHELMEYMDQDVANAKDIFLDQWNTISQSPKLMELMWIKMDDILSTVLMEEAGMNFDVTIAAELLGTIDTEMDALYNDLIAEGKPYFAEDFDYTVTPQQLAVLLFGGEYNVKRALPVLADDGTQAVYKGGARAGLGKTKQGIVVEHTPGFALSPGKIPKTSLGYSTADEHLLKLNHPYVEKVRRYRELSKDAETYYRGYAALVWHDGCIHPSHNHEIVVTGRLSCSSPNLSNVSKEDYD